MAEKQVTSGNGYDLNLEGSNNASNQGIELNLANTHDQLERGLKSRHIQFLALGMFYPLDSFASSFPIQDYFDTTSTLLSRRHNIRRTSTD